MGSMRGADADGNSVVNILDFSMLAINFGQSE